MFEKGKYILFWSNERNDMFRGKIISKQKDYCGHVRSYFVEYCYGSVAVDADNIIKVGDYKDVDVGLFKVYGVIHRRFEQMQEQINKLEKSNQLMIATLKAVRDILQEGKEDGKTKAHNCLCSGGCSGHHKSCNKNGVQKSR